MGRRRQCALQTIHHMVLVMPCSQLMLCVVSEWRNSCMLVLCGRIAPTLSRLNQLLVGSGKAVLARSMVPWVLRSTHEQNASLSAIQDSLGSGMFHARIEMLDVEQFCDDRGDKHNARVIV